MEDDKDDVAASAGCPIKLKGQTLNSGVSNGAVFQHHTSQGSSLLHRSLFAYLSLLQYPLHLARDELSVKSINHRARVPEDLFIARPKASSSLNNNSIITRGTTHAQRQTPESSRRRNGH